MFRIHPKTEEKPLVAPISDDRAVFVLAHVGEEVLHPHHAVGGLLERRKCPGALGVIHGR
jgi:hypothetical protein